MASDLSDDPARAGQPADTPLLSYTIGRLDRAVRQRLREILEPFELSIPQFTTLSVLTRRPGLSNAQLARRALILPQSMIQVIVGLEERQLVRREPDPAHNRVLRAELTAAGRQLLDAAERETRAFEAELVAVAGPETDVEQVVGVMQRWLDHMGATPPRSATPRSRRSG